MKNLAASIRARLLNLSRRSGVTLPSLIERFAMGRLLWRLSRSSESRRFILKGAQLFSLWMESPHRPTRDLDLLSRDDATVEAMREFFSSLLSSPAEPEDGLGWGEVEASLIREDQRYQGVRISAWASLAGAVVPVQVDIGFGDAVTPGPVELEAPARRRDQIPCQASREGDLRRIKSRTCWRHRRCSVSDSISNALGRGNPF